MSFGSSVIVIVSSQAHLTRVSLLSQPGTTARYPAGYPRHPAEGARTCHLGFPLPFGHQRSLLGSSQSRRGSGPSSRSAYRTRHACRTPSGLPRSTPTSCDRVGCLLDPGDGGALPVGCRARPAPAASQRPVPTPRCHIPSAGLRFTRHQRRFTQFTRPVCPLPVTPGWNGSPWAFPRASHPAVTSDARQGRGQAVSTHPELRHRHHIGLQSASPLARCDFVSQRQLRMFARWPPNMITVWLLRSTPTERCFDSNSQRGFGRELHRARTRWFERRTIRGWGPVEPGRVRWSDTARCARCARRRRGRCRAGCRGVVTPRWPTR